MKTEAIVFEDTFKVGIRSLELPALKDTEVLMETLYSTISPGTEMRTLAHREPHASPFPLVPGYSTVGKVVDFGPAVKGLKTGAIAYVRGCRSLAPGLGCSWGGHARHMISPQEEIFILPNGADPQTATLTALLATALHGVDLTRARIREQVALVGLGLVGQLCSRLLHYGGANVVATDLMEHRRAIAANAGIPVVFSTTNLREAFNAHFPYGAEVVFDATGSARAMKASLSLLRERPREDPCGADVPPSSGPPRGMFSILQEKAHLTNSWHGPRFIAQGSYADTIEINYYDLFNNEVNFVVPRVHEQKDVFRALELLVDKRFSLDGLISQTHPYSDAPAVYAKLKENPQDIITASFNWIS